MSRRSFYGHAAYCERFWGGDEVFYGHVLGAKGLRAASVPQAWFCSAFSPGHGLTF